MSEKNALQQRAERFQALRTPPRRGAWLCLGLWFVIALAGLGRLGLPWVQAAGLAACTLLVVVSLWLVWRWRRLRHDPEAMIRLAIFPADRALGQKALRAARLVRASAEGGEVTRQLAERHLQRQVEAATLQQVMHAAARVARKYQTLAFVLGMGLLVVTGLYARPLAEGLNLMAARDGQAPLPMEWVQQVRIEARPPPYLREPTRRLYLTSRPLLPVGTELTIWARPLYPNRELVLISNGSQEPFVSDGQGGLVAHHTVREDEELGVGARFGEYSIVESQRLAVRVRPDHLPDVRLQGAPARLRLSQLETLDLRWEAEDDHGLRQVDLVLRSGSREERRMLAYFERETQRERGGRSLRADDPFLGSLFLPAELSVEARDNNPATDSWGQSPTLVIVPEAIGEPEALRYSALLSALDELVKVLAPLAAENASASSAEALATSRERMGLAIESLETALGATYAGKSVPPGFAVRVMGRARAVAEAGEDRAKYRKALEEMVLDLRSALNMLGDADGRRVALLLSDAAEEVRLHAAVLSSPEAPANAQGALDAALRVADEGALQLSRLGAFGADLGSVAVAGLDRVRRSRQQQDWLHTELAAKHLAQRLQHLEPSFGSKGGGGSDASGPSSGQGQGGEGEAEEGGNGDSFQQLALNLRELAREHAGAVSSVDRMLREQRSPSPGGDARQELRDRAMQLRDAVEDLPLPGRRPGTPEAGASLGREHSLAMAHAMEAAELEQALESGRRARAALEDAASRFRDSNWLKTEARQAMDVVDEQMRWIADARRSLQARARTGLSERLEQASRLEQALAAEAQGLARRARETESPLPESVTQLVDEAGGLMRRAARQLGQTDGERGLELQRRAQALLERAAPGPQQDASQGAVESEPSNGPPARDGEVPGENENERALRFKQRVMRSLGEAKPGRLSPAVRRYAEGLLN